MDWYFDSHKMPTECKGLNDSGVETFKDDCLKGLAREICQNSLDARQPTLADDVPVIVEFHRFQSDKDQFPGRVQMEEAMGKIINLWRDLRHDNEVTQFFAQALSGLNSQQHAWIRISDFNTTGLKGVADDPCSMTPSPWSDLVTSVGVSNKGGSQGGSFGIGKFAPFSCSQIRTCFYSTHTVDGDCGFQGVTRLVSFMDAPDSLTTGLGYYRDNASPSHNPLPLDSGFERTEPGTDVFVPLFMSGDKWFEDIRDSVLEGFLYAIFKGKLEVRLLDGDEQKLIIDKGWLENWCSPNNEEVAPTVRQNYLALTSPEAKEFRENIGTDGWLELRIIVQPKFDRRISMIRETGMRIYGKDRFRTHIGFSGVLIAQGANLNKRLKAFENPQHTKWIPKRNESDKALLDKINQFCKDKVNECFAQTGVEEEDAGLGDVLPALGDSDNREIRETLTPKINTLKHSKRIKKRPVAQAHDNDDEGLTPVQIPDPDGDNTGSGGGSGETNNDSHGEDHHGGSGDGEGAGSSNEGDQQKRKSKKIDAARYRFICPHGPSGEYILFVTPKKSCDDGTIVINAVAELGNYQAEIRTASLHDGSPLAIEETNKVKHVRFVGGEQLVLQLTFDYSDYVSLEIELWS